MNIVIRAGFELQPKQRVEKVIRIMKVTHLLRIIGRHLPLRETLKRQLRALKRVVYVRRAKRYRKFINRPFPETKVLVVMNAGIGNAVEATPLVQAIRMLWPRAEITIFPPAGDLFHNWCVVDRAITSWQAVEGESFTHTFVTWRAVISKDINGCQFGNVHRVKRLLGPEFLKPEREYNLDMLRPLGYRGLTLPQYVSMRKPEEAIPSSPFRVCLVPGSKPLQIWRNRRWPYFDQLAASLLRNYPNAQICVIGTKDDPVPDKMFGSSEVVDLRSRLTLRETAWVLRHSALAIGNDCGPMHIADTVQTPSIVIFGQTCDVKSGPAYKSVPIRQDISCSPCFYGRQRLTCDNPICMKKLRPEVVMERANELLKATGVLKRSLQK